MSSAWLSYELQFIEFSALARRLILTVIDFLTLKNV